MNVMIMNMKMHSKLIRPLTEKHFQQLTETTKKKLYKRSQWDGKRNRSHITRISRRISPYNFVIHPFCSFLVFESAYQRKLRSKITPFTRILISIAKLTLVDLLMQVNGIAKLSFYFLINLSVFPQIDRLLFQGFNLRAARTARYEQLRKKWAKDGRVWWADVVCKWGILVF